MKTRQLTCVACPAGCRLKVDYQGKKVMEVTGNKCKRGLEFAAEEIASPARILTTTVALESDQLHRLPARSRDPVHRDKIKDLVRKAKKIKVVAPIKKGDCIVEDFGGSGVDLISSRTVSH